MRRPGQSLSMADVDKVWGVLNPGNNPFLTWSDFLVGVQRVKKDPEVNAQARSCALTLHILCRAECARGTPQSI